MTTQQFINPWGGSQQSTGQAIGSIVGRMIGAAIGAYAGNPLMGAAIGGSVGGSVGGAIDPYVTRNEQETIADFSLQTSEYGAPMVQIFGQGHATGNVFYLAQRYVEEEEERSGGASGGGGAVVTVSKRYKVDLGIGLCDTLITGPMAGIRRIWKDGTLWWNRNDGRPYPEGLTFYKGLAVQAPSPMMEAEKGVGNVPGYPHSCYVTLDDYDMGHFPHVPIFLFELYQDVAPVAAVHQLAHRATDGTLWAAAPGSSEILVYNGTTQEPTHRIDVDGLDSSDPALISQPHATPRGYPLGFESGGAALWMADPADYRIRRIDATTKTVTHIFAVPYSLLSGGVWHESSIWFCAYHYGTKVGYVIRASTAGITATITSGQARGGQMKLAVTAGAGGAVWVTDNHYPGGGGNSNAIRINPATNTITHTVSLGTAATSSPVDVAVTSDGHAWFLDAQANTLIRINTTPAVAATIALSATPLQLAVATDGYVWATTTLNGGTVYRINPATNTATAFVSLPLAQHSPAHPILSPAPSGGMWVLSLPTWTTQLFATDGTSTAVSTEGTPRALAAESTTHVWTGNTHGAVTRIETATAAAVRAPSVTIPYLKGVITALCGAAGLTPGMLNLTELRNPLVALKLANVQSVRTILELLMLAYQSFAIESNLQLKFRTKAPGSVSAVIPESSLTAYDADDAVPDEQGLVITQTPDEDLPTEIRVSYLSRARQFETNTQRAYVSNSRAEADNVLLLNFSALVLSELEAQRLAQQTIDTLWLQRLTYRLSVNRAYLFLEPGDLIQVASRGVTHDILLSEYAYKGPGIIDLQGRGDISEQVQQLLTPAPSVSIVTRAPLQAATTARLLNLSAVNSADQGARMHVAYEYGQTFWPGGDLLQSLDGSSYTPVHTGSKARATTGVVATALANGAPYVIDMVNTFTVVLSAPGLTLSSITDAALLAGSNTVQLGSEMLGVGVATLTAPQTYLCSRLLRGKQGTEWATGTHGSNEQFCLLNAAVHRLTMNLGDRGLTRQYKAVTRNTNVSLAPPQAFAATFENLVPWAVGTPQAARVGTDWMLTWLARSRFSGDWVDGQAFGYDPDFLSFRVTIYSSAAFTTITRTVDVPGQLDPEAVQTLTYTAAQQTTDFGAPQSTLYWKVASMSSYGLGRAANLTGVA